MSTKATALARVAVRARCEACAHEFSFETRLVGLASSLSDTKGEETLVAEATKQLSDQVEGCHRGRHLGVKKCPKCSHIQSWMFEDQKESRETSLFGWLVWSVILAVVSIKILHSYRTELGLEKVWDWISIPILLLLAFAYYRVAKLLVAVAGRSPNSVKVKAPSSHPLGVTLLHEAEVKVEREEVY